MYRGQLDRKRKQLLDVEDIRWSPSRTKHASAQGPKPEGLGPGLQHGELARCRVAVGENNGLKVPKVQPPAVVRTHNEAACHVSASRPSLVPARGGPNPLAHQPCGASGTASHRGA